MTPPPFGVDNVRASNEMAAPRSAAASSADDGGECAFSTAPPSCIIPAPSADLAAIEICRPTTWERQAQAALTHWPEVGVWSRLLYGTYLSS